MGSSYAPLWRRLLHHIPGLFKQCPGENYHWRWDQVCYCLLGTYNGTWRGGIYDFRLRKEITTP